MSNRRKIRLFSQASHHRAKNETSDVIRNVLRMWQNRQTNKTKKKKRLHFKTRLPPAARPSNYSLSTSSKSVNHFQFQIFALSISRFSTVFLALLDLGQNSVTIKRDGHGWMRAYHFETRTIKVFLSLWDKHAIMPLMRITVCRLMDGSLFTITFPLTPLERSPSFPVLPYVLFLVPL